MPSITAQPLAFPAKAFPGSQGAAVPSGILGELLASEIMGRYSHLVKSGKVFSAVGLLAASSPTIYSTNTLTGGPFLWNKPGGTFDCHILGMGVAVATAASTGTSGGLGITYGPQTAVPAATTAIDAVGNCLMGGSAPGAQLYRTATPTAAGTGFLPLVNVSLAATTAMFQPSYVDIGGALVVPQGAFASVAASSTQTNLVAIVTLVWAELPA